MFFMRINTKFGMLVELVRRVSYDVIPFTIFTFMWVGGITVLYIVLGSYDSFDEKSLINPFIGHLISTFENMIGNINNPTYKFWSDNIKNSHDDNYSNLSLATIYVIWFLWLVNQFFLLIILLNFLIAVISQSYECVME